MKNFISLTLLVILVTACSTKEPETPNTAPTVPTLVTPKDVCVDPEVVFTWNASTDAENNTINYYLQVSTKSDFSTIEKGAGTTDVTLKVSLTANKSYYWRVKAFDDKMLNSEYSAANSFTTANSTINRAPNEPQLENPDLNYVQDATSTSVRMMWNGSDPDYDTLVYDVYLDTQNPPLAKVSSAQSDTLLDYKVKPGKQYYWCVVATDKNGASTAGQVWTFSTKP